MDMEREIILCSPFSFRRGLLGGVEYSCSMWLYICTSLFEKTVTSTRKEFHLSGGYTTVALLLKIFDARADRLESKGGGGGFLSDYRYCIRV